MQTTVTLNKKNPAKFESSSILYEDNHLIAVSKPAGIATMGTKSNETSLLDQVKQYLKEKYQKPGNVYLGVVSRIDSFVSGVIVFAKTSKAASRLTEQFKQSSVRKKYYAVVEGIPQDSDGKTRQSGRLQSYLRKNDRLRRVESYSKEVEGSKLGILDFQLLDFNDDFSLLAIDLQTGRKHQIRSQFSDIGCPIFGDRKYDGQQDFGNRIALHANFVEISHPTKKERMGFESPIPSSWRQYRKISELLERI